MKYRITSILWAALFVLCAGLGFLPTPVGAVRQALTALSVLFFLPPGLLLYWANREKQPHWLMLVRNLAVASLLASLVLLVANLLSAMASEMVGEALYVLLIILAAPMVCSGIYALSLFLWACLLIGSLSLLRRQKKSA